MSFCICQVTINHLWIFFYKASGSPLAFLLSTYAFCLALECDDVPNIRRIAGRKLDGVEGPSRGAPT